MATTSDLDTLERETDEARARLAATLDRLSSPATATAVKQELTDYAQGLKSGLGIRATDQGQRAQRDAARPRASSISSSRRPWRIRLAWC